MAYSITWLFGEDARAGRERRLSFAPASTTSFVVHVELRTPHGSIAFQEVDADDRDHAERLARNWLRSDNAISAAIRKVKPDYSLGKALAILNPEVFEEGAYA